MAKKQKIEYTPHPAIYINSLNEPKLHIFRAFFKEPDLPKFKKYDEDTLALMESSANAINNTNIMMSQSQFDSTSDSFYKRSISDSSKKYTNYENSFIGKLKRLFSKKETIEKTFDNVKEAIEGNIPQNIKDAKEKIDVLIKTLKISGQHDLCKKLEDHSKILAYELILIENNYGKYLTEDDIIEFMLKCEKGINISFLRNYNELMPIDVIKEKSKVDDLKIFDNYVILHYDLNNSAFNKIITEEETKKARDPILFGMIEGSDKLYYITDWIYKDDDLTMKTVEKFIGRQSRLLKESKIADTNLFIIEAIGSLEDLVNNIVPR